MWNSEARFVVAGANEISMALQTDIFELLSKFRIYNCIVVSLGYDVIHKLYEIPIKINDVEKVKTFVVYTWFPYRSSDSCTEVNDITLLDSWVISEQGHFTKNTDLFPRKFSNSFNGCPMKILVKDGKWGFTTLYKLFNDSKGNIRYGLLVVETNLLAVLPQQLNMSLEIVLSLKPFDNLERMIGGMVSKEIYIALGAMGTDYFNVSYLDNTIIYTMMSISWYVPCSVKYPRWSSIFRIFSVELWLVLIISIVIAAISTTRVARYSCTPEWKGYKTLSSSLTNLWAVILGLSVSTMPRAPSLRSLFFAWISFSLAFSTVFQAFLTTFLIDSGYKTPIQNVEEMFASGINLAYPEEYNLIFENFDETEKSNIEKNSVICPPNLVCATWAMNQKNVSIMINDIMAADSLASGVLLGENTEPLFCRLEDGVVYSKGYSMVMLYGAPLMG